MRTLSLLLTLTIFFLGLIYFFRSKEDQLNLLNDKYVVFDFDGTIADSFPIIHPWLKENTDKTKIKSMNINEMKNYSLKSLFKIMGSGYFKQVYLAYKAKKYMQKNINQVPLFKDIKELLVDFKEKGYNCIILSSNSKENINSFLERRKISDQIDYVISGSSLFGKEKTVLKFMKKNSIDNNKIIYVGDEVRDIISMKKAKIKMISVSWGWNSYKILKEESPDMIVKSVHELKLAVKGILK